MSHRHRCTSPRMHRVHRRHRYIGPRKQALSPHRISLRLLCISPKTPLRSSYPLCRRRPQMQSRTRPVSPCLPRRLLWKARPSPHLLCRRRLSDRATGLQTCRCFLRRHRLRRSLETPRRPRPCLLRRRRHYDLARSPPRWPCLRSYRRRYNSTSNLHPRRRSCRSPKKFNRTHSRPGRFR